MTEIELDVNSGQVETTYPDGRSQVQYPGGAVKIKYPDGREDSKLPDGTTLWTDGKGHGVMTFPSGVKEIYTPICKVRHAQQQFFGEFRNSDRSGCDMF